MADWMAAVPDGTKLTEMTIPGTHNSAAYRYSASFILCNEATKLYVLCQDWDIGTQLKNGIRFFDVRLAPKRGALEMYHGQCYLNMRFGEFLDAVGDFLGKHTGEAVLVNYQGGNSIEWFCYLTRWKQSKSNQMDLWQKQLVTIGHWL